MHKKFKSDNWHGRIDHPTDSAYYRYHQVIQCEPHENPGRIGLIGFACDEGVRRNLGQTGAKEAPNALRKQLSSLPWRHSQYQNMLTDWGDIICEGQNLEQAQQQLGDKVSDMLQHGQVIILGGGHETLYGQYLGVRKAAGPDASIGMLNVDAHFDLRAYDDQPSSGTMFKQILDEDRNAHYFVCGIQKFGNTTALFHTADQYGVDYFLEEQLDTAEFHSALDEFIGKHDVLILTLCMDVLSAAEAPGVSAPSPFGLSALQVRKLLRKIASTNKMTSFSICEVNPRLDVNNQTAKLGAYFINEVIFESLS